MTPATAKVCAWCLYPLPEDARSYARFHPQCKRDNAINKMRFIGRKKLGWHRASSYYRYLLRMLCFRRQGGKCAYCNQPLVLRDRDRPIHVDHVQPVKYGGLLVAWNTVAACKGCNLRRGAPEDWPALLVKFAEFYDFGKIGQQMEDAYLAPREACFHIAPPRKQKKRTRAK